MSGRRGIGWLLILLPIGLALASPLLSDVHDERGAGFQLPEQSSGPDASRAQDLAAPEATPADTPSWAANFSISLHATAQGMKTWYAASSLGFEISTGVPYEELHCKSCHEPAATGGCAACHTEPTPSTGARVDASLVGVCGSCHTRQMAEATHYTDVHRELGMSCVMCHSREDVMGDGNAYSSMLEEGAIDATCEDCHGTLSDNPYHVVHQGRVDCSACHTQAVVSCYNCHFETEIQLDQKVAYGQFRDWIFLLNRDGKVHAANFQAVKHGDGTFVAIAPFHAHTIQRNARDCMDCHGNAAVRDYLDDGVIRVAWWDEAAGGLGHVEGVIPVPFDFLNALRFDFVDLDRPGGTNWSFLESGADRIQILFGEPLTESQMKTLARTALWRTSEEPPGR